MRKIKIISIILALVLMLGLISGCGVVEVSKFYDTSKVEKTYKKDKAYTTYERIDNDGQLVGCFDNLLLFKKVVENDNVWTYYDSAKKLVLLTESYPTSYHNDLGFVKCGEQGVVYSIFNWVDENQTSQYKIIIRDLNGVFIKDAVTTDINVINFLIPTVNLDLVKIGNDFYRLDRDDVYSLVARFFDSSVIPEFTAKNGDNYYCINEGNIRIFDKNLTLRLDYTAPTFANNVTYSILDNGNVLFQYQYATSLLEEDYSFVLSAVPIILESYIIDVDSLEFDDVNLKHYISHLVSRNTLYSEENQLNFEYLESDIYNLAVICEISDKQIDYTNKLVSLKNNGKVKNYYNDLFVGQKPVEPSSKIHYNVPTPVAKDRYIIKNSLDQILLLDGNGRVIGDVTSYDYINNKYIIINGTIFDFSLNALASCNEYEIINSYYLQNSFLFTKTISNTKSYFLFANGEFRSIADGVIDTVSSAYKNVISLMNYETGKITVITENSNILFTTEASLYTSYITKDGNYVVNGYNSNTQKFETYLIK
ncbi:MAG: hypothetical protein IKA12_03725 [Clostridia bacterium]|nr:hypothetical protein [Clostridia bacterium]